MMDKETRDANDAAGFAFPTLSTFLNSLFYFIAFGKPAGHMEMAPREFDVHFRWKPAREYRRKDQEKEEE